MSFFMCCIFIAPWFSYLSTTELSTENLWVEISTSEVKISDNIRNYAC